MPSHHYSSALLLTPMFIHDFRRTQQFVSDWFSTRASSSRSSATPAGATATVERRCTASTAPIIYPLDAAASCAAKQAGGQAACEDASALLDTHCRRNHKRCLHENVIKLSSRSIKVSAVRRVSNRVLCVCVNIGCMCVTVVTVWHIWFTYATA